MNPGRAVKQEVMTAENRNHNRIDSFRNAFSGWIHVVRTQRNAWIHLAATILVILVASWLHLPPLNLAVVFLAVGLVWMAELFNTAVEALVDLASPDYHPLAGIVKDVSAAAVLIMALTALIIGLLLILPPLLERILTFQF